MSLSDALKNKKLDVRLRDKFLAQGRLTSDELGQYQSSLTDDSDKMTVIESDEKKSGELRGSRLLNFLLNDKLCIKDFTNQLISN